jgi:hypothetical protein
LTLPAWLAAGVGGPISVSPIFFKGSAGPVHGFAATIDLADANVNLCVTGAVNPAALPKDHSAEVDAMLVPVDRWARDNKLTLAVNANYFGWKPGGGHIVGLVVSDGKVISPARNWKGQPDPALVFCRQGNGLIGYVIGPGQPSMDTLAISYAVAGVGGSASDDVAGSLLVQGGKNRGSTARVYPDKRLARTAAGLDASGRRLTLIVIDGRQPDWSVGVTLPELADLMIQRGVQDAVNLDGGGSSSFAFNSSAQDKLPDGVKSGYITNKPCDESRAGRPGVFRAVAVQLGFRLKK